LEEAAKFLSDINWKTSSEVTLALKLAQLRLERNYSQAVRLLQLRIAQFHFGSQDDKASYQVYLALMQRLADDTAGAKVTAEQARNALEKLKNEENDWRLAVPLSQAYAVVGEKDLALKVAEHAITLLPRGEHLLPERTLEENLAVIQTIFGERSRAISTLTQLLQTPYNSWLYGPPITPALLRLDPLWDPLRGDPAFQKLCEEKQP
jgi:serine/threonine-protein kinase